MFDPTQYQPCNVTPVPVYDWSVENWASREKASEDEQEIVRHLSLFRDIPCRSILHVGVGNSWLATRLCVGDNIVEGVTINPQETQAANEKCLLFYRTVTGDKHNADTFANLRRSYEWIVDPELTSHSCCMYHMLQMIRMLGDFLTPCGSLWTHENHLHQRWPTAPIPCMSVNEFNDVLHSLNMTLVANHAGVLEIRN